VQVRSTSQPTQRTATPAREREASSNGVDGAGSLIHPTARLPRPAGGSGDHGGSLPPFDEFHDQYELAEHLDGMAASLAEVDPRSSERLADLAGSVGSEEGRIRWADVDLRRAFNTERLAQVYAIRREGGFASSMIETADRIRNVLVLLPIFLTWFALAEASRAYKRYIDANPESVGQPFLLLWQDGFGGELGGFSPTFSTVAIIDAVIIGLIIGLTFYAHGRREAKEEQIQRTADQFQTDLDNVLAEATVALAQDRSNRPAQLARSVERLADRFERNSQELLNRLRVEHDRLEGIANRREKEFHDFGVFASGMRAGAEETHRLLIDLRQVSQGLQTALEDLTSEVGVAGDQQRHLLGAVGSLERLVSANIQSDQTVARQLSEAAGNLADVADQAIAGAEEAAHAGRVASEAVRGIAELTSKLADSQTRVETALAKEVEHTGRLADALVNSVGGVSASSQRLEEIGVGLAHLRTEFGQLSHHTSEQVQILRALLSEQNTLAAGLAQATGDVSKVSVVTAQRQREVNENLATLLGRLDQMINVLARYAGNLPSPEALQHTVASAVRSELAGAEVAAGEKPGTGGLWSRGQRRP
jgi:hypothetical protein